MESNRPSVELNHLIIPAKQKQKTADFLTNLLDLPTAKPADGPVPGFFLCIQFTNDVMVLIAEAKDHSVGHYAFRVGYEQFQQVLQRLRDWQIDYWADPKMQRPFECYEENENQGLYFIDPSGHGMEILCQLPSAK